MPRGELEDEDVQDSLDEELEMEVDDERLAAERRRASTPLVGRDVDRQALLPTSSSGSRASSSKLQDWVVEHKLKVVVVFEGRDAAGKGGAIKRITQRLNPRVCRVAALPAPDDASARSGISSATSRICRPAAKSCSSTAAGTTAPASSG